MIFATAGGYFYYSTVILATRTTTGLAVQTAIAQRGDLVVSASGNGTLIAQSDASFGFETSGQVTEIHGKVGDHVEAGQLRAQLDDTLEAQAEASANPSDGAAQTVKEKAGS